jgi:hypothetical protein
MADWFFWGLFLISGYWFCFFKLQVCRFPSV